MVVALFLARVLYTRLKAHEQGIVPSTPRLVTFEAVDTLVRRFLPVGHLYRDTLLRYSGLMLPRPDVFEDAYVAAIEKQSAVAPRFGAGTLQLDDWWRAVAKRVYDEVLADYGEKERSLVDKVFDRVFDDVYAQELVGDDYWQKAPAAERVLEGLREWRDERDGPRIGVISLFDARLADLLKNLFGEDVVLDTFDFIATNSDEELPFDVAAKVHGLSADSCLHVHPYDDLDVPYRSLQLAKASDEFPYDDEGFPRDQLVDLVDMWGLTPVPEDDILVVNRQFFPFDPDFDHGSPDSGPDADDADMQPPSYADPDQRPNIPPGGYPPVEQREDAASTSSASGDGSAAAATSRS